MKISILCLIMFIPLLHGLQPQNDADKITGIWSNEEGSVENEIYRKGDTFEAKIIKGKAYIGTVTMYKLKYNGNEWHGKAYQPKSGRTADVILILKDDNTLLIKASMAGISKTKIWIKVK